MTQSPLNVDFPAEKGSIQSQVSAKLAKREPLAKLKSGFSGQKFKPCIEYLTLPIMEGRGLGTAGLDRAAEYIARRFKEIGLVPAGDKNSYYHVAETSKINSRKGD